MNDKIRNYVDGYFKAIESSKQLTELKEEITTNITARYNDYISSDLNQEEAFDKATVEFGAINELIADLVSQEKELNHELLQKQKENLSLFSTIFWPVIVIIYYVLSLPLNLLVFSWIIWPLSVPVYMAVAWKIAPDMKSSWFIQSKDVENEKLDYIRLTPEVRAKKKKIKDFTNFSFFVLFIIFIILGFLTGAWYLVWIIFPLAIIVIKLVKVFLLNERLD